MLIADQNRIKEALSAFGTQVEAGYSLNPQQHIAFKTFYDRYIKMLHHHHDNEEKIAFPYFKNVHHVPSTKVCADHKSILEMVEKCNGLVASLPTVERSMEAEAIQELSVRLKVSKTS